MDGQSEAVSQQFNGGIIFVSYVIATVGAQTTLELLGRRTHITGVRNWLLLMAAAVAMGGVGIWSMHFIGNNSLSLTYHGDNYHLTYSAGYTFASLAVAIGCMFVAFAFVGITEEAKVSRIIPSGVIAGIGIVCMHYIGQFAIESFHLRYKIPYVAGASIIACVAVVAALYIFFKLREKWANRWYKRLGSSLLMGLAVCGMHYTAMVGTEYSVPPSVIPNVHPVFRRGPLIGTISAIVVLACGLLLFIAVRAGVVYIPAITETNSHRLLLDTIFFDGTGRILVNVEGRVPSREILPILELNGSRGHFNSSHPLFLRFFEVSSGWAKYDPNRDNRPSEQSSVRTRNPEDLAESAFVDAARDLVTELRLGSLADLGILFDGVISTNTIGARCNNFFDSSLAKKANRSWRWWRRTKSRGSSKDRTSTTMLQAARQNKERHSEINRLSSINSFESFASAAALEHGHGNQQPENKNCTISFHSFAGGSNKKRSLEEQKQTAPSDTIITATITDNHRRPYSGSTTRTSEANDAVQEDRHVALVRQIGRKEQMRLLSQGYRFADPIFISKTMGTYLRIPSDHMSLYFDDMRLLAQSSATLLQIKPKGANAASAAATPIPLSDVSSAASFVSDNEMIPDRATKGAVYVGLSALFQEDRENNPMHIHIMIEKARRNAFPMVQLAYDDGEVPVQLSREERNCLLSLEGQSLQDICSTENHTQLPRESGGSTLFDRRRSTSDWAIRSDATATTIVGNELSSNEPGSLSPISASDFNKSTVSRFVQALEESSRVLMGKSVYGKPLASLAKLQGEVLDIPPFSLTLGPCQLILFRAWVTSPGTVSAINQTSHETTKCIPIPLFRSLAYHITDQAVSTYKTLALRNVPESAYVTQQRVYQSTASSYAPAPPGMPLPSLPEQPHRQQEQPIDEKTLDETSKQSPKRLSELVSLPPPPRTRKPKIQLPPGGGLSLASLDNVTERARRNYNNAPPLAIELPTILTILPTFDRFWWLNNVIDETMHMG